MLLTAFRCPICEQVDAALQGRCPACGALTTFEGALPAFDRTLVNDSLLQAGIERARRQLKADPQDGAARYALGLAYLNLGLREPGLDELRRAADLLPEQHRIRYELALVSVAAGEATAGIDQLDRALKLAPEQMAYRYLERYLLGVFASERQKVRDAVAYWVEAYRLNPDAALAREALQQFVQTNEARLTQPAAAKLPGLTTEQQEALRLLNGRAKAATQRIPGAPRTPRPLGKTSMRLLRKYAPARAAALEQMYAERVAAHAVALEQYESQRQSLSAQNEAAMAAHEERLRQIHADLPLLAELCAVALEFEIQQRQEAERRRREQEERQRAAAASRAAATAATAGAPTAAVARRVKERHFLTVDGRYQQGLPVGKGGDSVTLRVSNQWIVFQHSALIGGWEYKIPMSALVEVADDLVKHTFSTEHRLRLSYRDPQGMVAHAQISGVKVEHCVRKILQARSEA